ncbi:PilX N-terminal domain-containing pilus assembly protein [Zoogloeaceae bacterium G21618-S1]|nr:PilX N-terminal domain-containing pilus assembly protein [Zoogloeaceae bacterium G21618-S1]
MTPRNHFKCPPSSQSGSALIVGLILLLVMTMLGLTAMQTTSLEERMSGNMRDRDLAAQAAEMALRAGENEALTALGSLSGNGVFSFPSKPAPDESIAASWKTTSNVRGWAAGNNLKAMTSYTAPSSPAVSYPSFAEAPDYWIEERPGVYSTSSLEPRPADVRIFDITARSTGASGTSTVILRSTVMQ